MSTKLKKIIHRRNGPPTSAKLRESLLNPCTYDKTYEQDGITFTVFYTDGASRGNPGVSSIGVYVPSEEGRSVGELIPSTTNNVAEYKAFIRAFDIAYEMKLKHVEIRSDSKLVVNQLNGEYKIKSPDMLHLYTKTKEQEDLFENVIYTYVPREQNRKADMLCNAALDDKKLAVYIGDIELGVKKNDDKKGNEKEDEDDDMIL